MKQETLKKANELSKLIQECNQAFNCFEYRHVEGSPVFSLNPRLIIEFDNFDDGRDRVSLPMNLSDTLINFLIAEIEKVRQVAIKEFESL
jgi:hypothetical protein